MQLRTSQIHPRYQSNRMSSDRPKASQPTRRTFLKGSSVAVAATALSPLAPAQSTPTSTPSQTPSPQSPADIVNLLQGTRSTPQYSTGNTLPIAALPFGMAHWTFQTSDKDTWFFHPDLRRTQGIRCTHQLSPWLGDYGHATFLPFRGSPNPAASRRASSCHFETAELHPYSLDLLLFRYRSRVELIPTERCGLLSADFEPLPDEPSSAAEPRGLIIDIPTPTADILQLLTARRIHFTSTATSGGTPPNFATYYILEFSQPWAACDITSADGHTLATVSFKDIASLQTKIATSFISFDQAAFNLTHEIGDNSINDLRDQAKSQWNTHLQRIEIEGATPDQQRTFYSCLYRTLLFPRIWHEPNPKGGLHHFSAYNGKIVPGLMYADHGYWDVYRAWYPFLSIFFPDRLADILQAWVNAYKEGGWLPQFPCPGYRACMTGSLIDAVFGDAAAKNIPGFDLATAFLGLKKHSSQPGDPSKGYGRRGIEQYLKLHYVPADQVQQSNAETVDAAYGDFCIAQVADALGHKYDAHLYTVRSTNWRNLFDPQVRFLRGKNADGSWLSPFDPFTWGDPYVEGSAWQHRWDAPHDIPGMIALMGGPVPSAQALERMLTVAPIFNTGTYAEETHEMAEMASVPFGQYAQCNQPVHHILYLFAHAGRPDRTQYWARRVMNELYSPHTFPGDEDTGSMSAWFILSALGFYPTCPGKPEYTLGSPLFPRATLHLPENKTLVITAQNNSPATLFVQQTTFNNTPIPGPTIPHEALMQGGTLNHIMTTAHTA
jgi:predicted alpha-1,2-mannosidase